MNERIDHAAQARKIMLEVNTDDRGVVPLELLDEIEKWVYDATMREAQVHATLALVEQKRIANLIAYMDGWDTHDVSTEEMSRLREGLGLS